MKSLFKSIFLLGLLVVVFQASARERRNGDAPSGFYIVQTSQSFHIAICDNNQEDVFCRSYGDVSFDNESVYIDVDGGILQVGSFYTDYEYEFYNGIRSYSLIPFRPLNLRLVTRKEWSLSSEKYDANLDLEFPVLRLKTKSHLEVLDSDGDVVSDIDFGGSFYQK
jgi:hypothetical protein